MVAIVGTGPAGLMAAWVLANAGIRVTLFEKKSGPARKLLIAGSTGLNISHALPIKEFRKVYRGDAAHFERLFAAFPPEAWLKFIGDLGLRTFQGAGRRYFIEGMKASPLVRAWLRALAGKGVEIRYGRECVDFNPSEHVRLRFADGEESDFEAVCFALGGGSHEKQEVRWPALFETKKLKFRSFRASNVGFEVDWPRKLLQEAEGLPIKNITLTSPLGTQSGDLVITRYGLEGTPVYRFGEIGAVFIDLKPDVPANRLMQLARSPGAEKENLSPIRRVTKLLKLSPAALAVIFHCTPREILGDLDALIPRIKRFPLVLKARRPLAEAISSAGGLAFEELDESLMLRRFPGVFAAGEMLDWDAPTGGFLIQACASQGFLAGHGIIEYLERKRKM